MSALGASYSRRTFLKLATCTLFLGSSGCSLGRPGWEETAERMIATLNYPDRARLIGSLYIDETHDVRELTAEQWTGRLLKVLKLEPEQITKENLDSLADQIRQKVRQDFVDENVVIVKAYMFSKTEIMLCSLVASYALQT